MEEALLKALLDIVGPTGLLVTSSFGALIVVAEVVVALTPSTKDDEFWGKVKAFPIVGGLVAAIAKMAPIQKKPKE